MDFLTMKQTAEMLQISYDAFWKMLRDGDGLPPHVKLGKRKRWVKEQVIEWAKNRAGN